MLHGEEFKIACETVLYKAEELLKIGWCKTWALDKEGKNVQPEDETACAWCLEGAMMAATYHLHPDVDERKQVIDGCLLLVQSANKEFLPELRTNEFKLEYLNKSSVGSRISKHSVVPKLNDRLASTQEQVVKWVSMARRLAKLSKWGS